MNSNQSRREKTKMDPPRADIRMGYLCNNNCKFCCVGEHRKFNLSTKEVIDKLDFARKNKVEKVVFTGGEPTVRKDIFKLIRYASDLGFAHILIITNGRMCSYPGFLEKLVNNGLTDICYSIPDIRKQQYEYLTQVKGSYDELMTALENTKKHELLVSTITTITKTNYDYLPEITRFLLELNQDIPNMFSELMFINPTDNAWRYKDVLVPKISEVTPYVHESLDIASKKGYPLNVEAIPLCYMKGYEDNVVELHMAKERVYLDPEKKADFNYNENRKVQGKVKSRFCNRCQYKGICEGVWRSYAKIHGIKELRYDNPFNRKLNKKKSRRDILIQMGDACNQRCLFCSQNKFLAMNKGSVEKTFTQKENLEGKSTEEIKQEIVGSKAEKVTFVGGEPTIRKDLPELIKFAKKNGVKDIIVNTNGVKLSDRTYLEKLKKAGLTTLLISLHSHKKEISEKISRVPGNYEKTSVGIKNSLTAGLKVNLVHVIFKDNYTFLYDFVEFVRKKYPKIKAINFVFIKPNKLDKDENKEFVPRLSQIKEYLKKAMKLCKDNDVDFTVANIPVCFMQGFEDHNTQRKELKEIESENPFDAWMKKRKKSNERDEYGYKDERCNNCDEDIYCIGLLKDYQEIYGTEELNPIDRDY